MPIFHSPAIIWRLAKQATESIWALKIADLVLRQSRKYPAIILLGTLPPYIGDENGIKRKDQTHPKVG